MAPFCFCFQIVIIGHLHLKSFQTLFLHQLESRSGIRTHNFMIMIMSLARSGHTGPGTVHWLMCSPSTLMAIVKILHKLNLCFEMDVGKCNQMLEQKVAQLFE